MARCATTTRRLTPSSAPSSASFLLLFLLPTALFAACPVCNDHSAPPIPYHSPRTLHGQTCGELYNAAGRVPAGETCGEWLSAGLLCGCPVPAGKCHLCPSGRDVHSWSRRISYQGGTFTCGELVRAAAMTADIGTCEEEWAQEAKQCCSENIERPQSGSSDKQQEKATTGEEQEEMATGEEEEEKATEQEESMPCSLCADGSDPQLDDAMVGGQPCRIWQASALFVTADVCSFWQATVGKYCACPDVVDSVASSSSCQLCSNQDLPHLDAVAALAPDGRPMSCVRAELDGATYTTEECTVHREQYSAACCQTDQKYLSWHEALQLPSPTVSPTLVPTTRMTPVPVAFVPTNDERESANVRPITLPPSLLKSPVLLATTPIPIAFPSPPAATNSSAEGNVTRTQDPPTEETVMAVNSEEDETSGTYMLKQHSTATLLALLLLIAFRQ